LEHDCNLKNGYRALCGFQGDVQFVEDLEESDDDMEDVGAAWGPGLGSDDDDSDRHGDESDSASASGSDRDAAGGAAQPAGGQRHKRQRGDEGAGPSKVKRFGPSSRAKPGQGKRRRGVEIEWEEEREALPVARQHE
jgi:hypothetical protein